MTHIQVQHDKNRVRYVVFFKYTAITQSILGLIFSVSVGTMRNYTTVDKNLKTISGLRFWHTCDFEKGQGPQTWYELLVPKQAYNHAKLEIPPLTSVSPPPKKKKKKTRRWSFCFFVVKSEKQVSYFPWTCEKVKNSGMSIIYLTYLKILQDFNLTG